MWRVYLPWLFDPTERTLDVSVLRMQGAREWTLLAEGVILVGGGLPSVSSDGAEVLVRDARIRGTAGVASATAGA